MPAAPLPLLGAAVAESMGRFEAAFADHERQLRRLWMAAAAAWRVAAPRDREFVSDQLAVVMGVHPQTAQGLLAQALLAVELPELIESWQLDEITDRHVVAAIDELHACLPDAGDRTVVLGVVLAGCRERAAGGGDWPRPGQLRRLVRAAALTHDRDAARRRRTVASGRRGVRASALPDGQAVLCLDGPQEQVLAMAAAVRDRATALGRERGEGRTLAQLSFDVAHDLLTGVALSGGGVGVEVQVLVPFATAAGRGEALGELVGMGPVLPDTCRELLARADRLRRVCVDAVSGAVLAVDQPVPASPAALARLGEAPLVAAPLCTTSYRPTPRALRFVRTRDRTCRFPGCTTSSGDADVDHRTPWPHGPTDPANLQCLCRHHHRAKQSDLFTVAAGPHGSVIWTVVATGRTSTTWPIPVVCG